MRHSLPGSAVVVAVGISALSFAACSDDRTVPLAPAPFVGLHGSSGFAVAVVQPTLFGLAVVGAACPVTHPFAVPFDLQVRAGASPMNVHHVQITFVDSFGTSGPQLSIPEPVLNNRFRTLNVAAQTLRVFPFSFEFGCGTARWGTLSVFVDATDPLGRMQRGSFTVPVR